MVEVEDRIFWFSVSNCKVGLLVYSLKSFSCESFKLFFHLWNETGITLARASVLLDQGPHFEWTPVKSKKNAHSFADVAKLG
jgi:hypothetical protein